MCRVVSDPTHLCQIGVGSVSDWCRIGVGSVSDRCVSLNFNDLCLGLKHFLVHDFDRNVKNLFEKSPVSIQNGHI